MSVILTSGKRSAQKLREGAKKDKPGKVTRPKTAMPSNSYMPGHNVFVWNEVIDGSDCSIALRRDTMQVWCNDDPVELIQDFKDDGSYSDFVIKGHKARIEITQLPDKSGIQTVLTIEGRIIPQVKAT